METERERLQTQIKKYIYFFSYKKKMKEERGKITQTNYLHIYRSHSEQKQRSSMQTMRIGDLLLDTRVPDFEIFRYISISKLGCTSSTRLSHGLLQVSCAGSGRFSECKSQLLTPTPKSLHLLCHTDTMSKPIHL